jgi:hypothetical protein
MFTAWAPGDVVKAGIKLLDWFAASKDNYLVQTHGVPGVDWRYVDRRGDLGNPIIEHISDKQWWSYTFVYYAGWDAVTSWRNIDWLDKMYADANIFLGAQQPWFQPDWFVPYDFKGTLVEKNEAAAVAFINGAIADIIMNKAPLSGWDAKVAEYRAMWADQFIKVATAQYKKAIGRK